MSHFEKNYFRRICKMAVVGEEDFVVLKFGEVEPG
jgi:hypothetical protein